jgi:putative FmdB family regulatory protein
MPIYEYKCSRCNQKFEKIEKFSAEPLTVHEGCGGPVERQVSSPALMFKGSGFYITDYAKSGKSGGSEAKAKKEAKQDSTSDSKSHSKSDSATSSSTDSKAPAAAASTAATPSPSPSSTKS